MLIPTRGCVQTVDTPVGAANGLFPVDSDAGTAMVYPGADKLTNLGSFERRDRHDVRRGGVTGISIRIRGRE
jgi:hypothetical protein